MNQKKIQSAQHKSALKWFIKQLKYGVSHDISMNGKSYTRTYSFKMCKSKICGEQIIPKLEPVKWADGSTAYIPESSVNYKQRVFHSEECKRTVGKEPVNDITKRDIFLYGSRGARKIAGLI